jgi:hypothetical protein
MVQQTKTVWFNHLSTIEGVVFQSVEIFASQDLNVCGIIKVNNTPEIYTFLSGFVNNNQLTLFSI